MIPATPEDKILITDLLSRSFDKNKSVNYVLKQDDQRPRRMRVLMEYVFEMCYHYGGIWLTPERNAVVLVLLPERKKRFFHTLKLDFRLATGCIGLSRVMKVLKREGKIKKYHPKEMIYLWFIGVEPEQQGKGTGSRLLQYICDMGRERGLPVCLETSTPENLPFYKKAGFEVYQELDFGHRLYMFRKEANKTERS